MFSNHQHFHNLYTVDAPKMTFTQSVKALYEILCKTASTVPQQKIPQCVPNLKRFNHNEAALKFIWFGHSTLLLNLDQQKILIDPMFSTYASPIIGTFKRFQAPVLSLDELPLIDVIVISHDHYDHLDKKSIAFFHNKQTHFIVPRGVGDYLRRWGIPPERIHELNWYESYHIGTLSYTATPAHHFSGRTLFSRNKTLWASWVIQGSQKLFFSGDSAYSPHFKEIGARYGAFDVAFMENGQYDSRWLDAHMMPEQSVQAIQDIHAQYFVPIHWGMFRLSTHHWLEPMIRSLQLTQHGKFSTLYPFIGETITLP